MRRCAPNSTRSNARPPRSKPNRKGCARISNCRANPTAGWKARSIELSNDIAARNSQIAATRAPAGAREQRAPLRQRSPPHAAGTADAGEKRIGELEGELAAAREKLALLEDEKRSLQLAVDQALNETARLTRRLTETENTSDRDPRPTRQGRSKLRRGLCRTRPPRRRARRGQGAAPGRTQQPQHASRCAAVAHRHRRAAVVGSAAEPHRPHRGSARLRPQVGGSHHWPQQFRKAAGPDRGRARSARAPDQGSRSRPHRAHRAQQCPDQDARRPARPRWPAPKKRSPRSPSATAIWKPTSRSAAPISKSASRTSIRRCNASAWNARWSKARWKPRARTIHACKARSRRCARRCGAAFRSTRRRWRRPSPPTTRHLKGKKGKSAELAQVPDKE